MQLCFPSLPTESSMNCSALAFLWTGHLQNAAGSGSRMPQLKHLIKHFWLLLPCPDGLASPRCHNLLSHQVLWTFLVVPTLACSPWPRYTAVFSLNPWLSSNIYTGECKFIRVAAGQSQCHPHECCPPPLRQSPIALDWLASRPQESCHCFSSTGIEGALPPCPTVLFCFWQVLKTKLSPWYWKGKCFTESSHKSL